MMGWEVELGLSYVYFTSGQFLQLIWAGEIPVVGLYACGHFHHVVTVFVLVALPYHTVKHIVEIFRCLGVGDEEETSFVGQSAIGLRLADNLEGLLLFKRVTYKTRRVLSHGVHQIVFLIKKRV